MDIDHEVQFRISHFFYRPFLSFSFSCFFLSISFFPAGAVPLLSELEATRVRSQQLVLAHHAHVNSLRLAARPLYGLDLRRRLRFVKVSDG